MMNISYSQVFEDARLWRALSDTEAGFYIDVGASWPKQDSVTQLFYEHGWSGINVEPLGRKYQALLEERPRDINLNLLIGDQQGTSTFYSVNGGNGLSTTRREYADEYQSKGAKIDVLEIECTTLASIYKEYVKGPVHFLKVDVEGAEREVLRGANLSEHRPWIIVIEATKPETLVPVYDEWEAILIDSGYHFACTDDLNRFYVVESEMRRLAPRLSGEIGAKDGFEKWQGMA